MIIMITGDIDGLPGLYVMIISLCGTIRDHQDNFEIIIIMIIMTIDHLYQRDHDYHLSAVRPHPALGANARSRDAKAMTGTQRVGAVS